MYRGTPHNINIMETHFHGGYVQLIIKKKFLLRKIYNENAFSLCVIHVRLLASSEQEKVKNSTRKMAGNSNSPESKVRRYRD